MDKRVTGIGGIFFRSKDPKALGKWYADHLGIDVGTEGNMTVFDWAHSYLWPALIMLDVLIVWMIWIRTLPRSAFDLGRSPADADADLQQATAR